MRYLKWIALVFWYGLYVYVALTYYQSVLSKTSIPSISFAKAILGLVLLTAFFVLLHLALGVAAQQRELTLPVKASSAAVPTAYPSEVTIRVRVWLLAVTGFLVLGLFFVLNSICWPDWLMKCLEKAPDVTNAAATMFGAGIGSSVATIGLFGTCER